MKQIKFPKNRYALVDDRDYLKILKYKWHIDGRGYVMRNRLTKDDGSPIQLHRLILNPSQDKQVDHINGDRLDNRRDNLRVCSKSQNMCNRGPQKNNTSGFKGIYYDKFAEKWRAKANFNGKVYSIARSKSKDKVIRAYNRLISKIQGEFAKLIS